MKKIYSFLTLFGAAAVLGVSMMGEGMKVGYADGEPSKNVPISSIDAWKLAGGWECASSYVNAGVKVTVPGADTKGTGDAWKYKAYAPNDSSTGSALSFGEDGKVSIDFSIGFYDDQGTELVKSQNGNDIDIVFFSDLGHNNEIARLRIWADSAGALNGSHSKVAYNPGWADVSNGYWIAGDATLGSHFTVGLDKTNYLTAICAGQGADPVAVCTETGITTGLNLIKDLNTVYVAFAGDNGFNKSCDIVVNALNGQSLANDGTNMVDNVAPKFNKEAVSASISLDEEYEIPVTASDLFGPVSYSVKIGETVTAGKKFTPTVEGALAVDLIAEDGAGNKSTKTLNFTVVNNIEAPTFTELPQIAGGQIEPLQKLEFGMPTITDSTGTAVVKLNVKKGEETLVTLENNDDKFSYIVPTDFVAGDYSFVYEATNKGGTTLADPINVTYTVKEMPVVPFVTSPDTKSIATYSDKGLYMRTLNNWRKFSLGEFDIGEGFDIKYLVDDSENMDNAAVAIHLVNVDDPNYVIEYRVWAGFSGGDRPTNVYLSTDGWQTITDITDTGWISRQVDGVDNQYHMAFNKEDTFVGERLGGMQRVDKAYDQLKALVEAAPSYRYNVSMSLGKDGIDIRSVTVTSVNGQAFAAPITWNNAYLALQSTIPEQVAKDTALTIKAYAKDIRQACEIKLAGTDPESAAIDETFVNGAVSYTFSKTGTYNLVIKTTGANGQEVKIERSVMVKSSVDPVEITVAGTYEATYATNTEITILNATYSANVVKSSIKVVEPGEVKKDVKAGDKYKFAKPGLYKIVYEAEDAATPTPNKATREFTINVPDAEKPVITITGNAEAKVGDNVELTIKVEDASSVDVAVTLTKPDATSAKLTGSNDKYSFKAEAEGKYSVKVVAEDVYGNKETKTFDVTVTKPAQKSGCGGSVIAASALVSITSIIGATLLLKKRKEK